jgi:uncharacterized protein YuzE
MIGSRLEVTFRRGKPFVAYFHLPHERSDSAADTRAFTDDLIVDYADDGRPIGIEIVSPGYVTRSEIEALLEQLGLDTELVVEFAPVLAKSEAA